MSPVMTITVAGSDDIPEEEKENRRMRLAKGTPATLAWEDDPCLPQQADDQGAQQGEAEAQVDQSVEVEEAEDIGQEIDVSVERDKISSQPMYMPLEEYFGYVLLDQRVEEKYSVSQDGETKWVNVYDWKDLAVLLTKELHQELLIKVWNNLLINRDVPRVDPNQPGFLEVTKLEQEMRE